MIKFIHKIHEIALKILDTVTGVLLLSMLSFVVIQVVARYVFVASTPWTEEGARILMIWICFIGSASMMIRKEHLVVDVFYHRFSKSIKRYLHLIFDIGILLFAFFISYNTIDLISRPMIWRGTTTVCHIPLAFYYGSLLICMLIVFVYEILDIIESIYNIKNKIDVVEKSIDDMVEGGTI